MSVQRHHEELLAVPTALPALWLLVPFAGGLWARIKWGGRKG
jgi:hypothetical protein